MHRSVYLLLLILLPAAACKTPKLARRLPGTWYIEHYDEYAAATDSSTGHALDGAGYMQFYRDGRVARSIRPDRPHGSLTPYDKTYRWQLADSLVSITGPQGELLEEWFVSKDLTDYLEVVSVNPARDSVRTMYLRK